MGARRADGYHQLATVYQAVNLYDEVHVSARDDNEITVEVHYEVDVREDESIPAGSDNIAVRAAELLRESVGKPELGADIVIRKVIPVAGGMAGGSADAAGALVACNEIWGLGLDRSGLEPIAAALGSDVPFLLHGGNAIGTGRGETVNQVLGRGTYHWVCVTSSHGLSTAEVYAEFDRLNPGGPEEPVIGDDLLAALRAGDPAKLGRALSNDLTDATLSLRPELEYLIEFGLDWGAEGAIISGSGPTVLFLLTDQFTAEVFAQELVALDRFADVIQSWGPVPGARLV